MGANAIGQIGFGSVDLGGADPAARAERGTAATGAPGAEDAVGLDIVSNAVPDEVIDAIAAAAQAYDRLSAGGRHVSFAIDPPSGRVQITLQDSSGRPISGLSPSDALRLAAGERLA